MNVFQISHKKLKIYFTDTTERPNVYPSLNCLKNFSLLWVSVDNWFNLLLPELQHNEENNQGNFFLEVTIVSLFFIHKTVFVVGNMLDKSFHKKYTYVALLRFYL